MAKILLGWEMGTGFGHLSKLIPVLKGLKRNGHQPVLAVKSLANLRTVKELEIDIFQAPWVDTIKLKRRTLSLADILEGKGWDDPIRLKMMVMGWRSLIDVLRPDLIISDYSPCLNLAAFKKVPTVVLGTGFTVPPNQDPLPPMRPWHDKVPPGTLKTQRNIEKSMNWVAQEMGITAPRHLGEIFHDFRSYVLCLPLLDPYARFRDQPQLPNLRTEALAPPVEAKKKAKMFFAYLDSSYRPTGTILKMLSRLKYPSEAYVSGLPPRLREKMTTPNLILHDSPQALGYIFGNFKALVHHGGTMAQDAAAAGLPQLLFPKQAEQIITTRLLADAGVAVGVAPAKAREANIVKKGIETFFNKPRWSRALEISAQIRGHYQGGSMEKIVEECVTLLDS